MTCFHPVKTQQRGDPAPAYLLMLVHLLAGTRKDNDPLLSPVGGR
jgi:hypothetical protein